MNRILIAYFSRKGENYSNGKMVSLEEGNTERAAVMIQEITGADIFEIRRITDYPEAYRACVTEAVDEMKRCARPELKKYLSSIADYDLIILGYPNWCGTMPMPVFTFLEHYDFAGKKILPFCTNEGSQMGHSEKDIADICPNAIVLKGLSIHGSDVSSSFETIERWIKESIKG